MARSYSTYEAKAKLSELLRLVRERGETITITRHGEAIAELRPVAPVEGALDRHLRDLASRGVLIRSPRRPPYGLEPGPRKRGALKRFLDDRGE